MAKQRPMTEARQVARIRKLVENSPGQKVDLGVLRHQADRLENGRGDSSLHDALDQTEREVIRHNKDVHKGLSGGTAPGGATMGNASERAMETRRRTAEHFKQEKAKELERKRGLTAVAPTSDNHSNGMQYGESFNRRRNGRGFSG